MCSVLTETSLGVRWNNPRHLEDLYFTHDIAHANGMQNNMDATFKKGGGSSALKINRNKTVFEDKV